MTDTGGPPKARLRGAGHSLSGRLLLLTAGFTLLAQIAIYAPVVAAQHQSLLRNRIAAAQTAVLALEETQDNQVSPRLRQELLANAGVKAVALKRDEARLLFLADDLPGPATKLYDLRVADMLTEIGDAAECLWGDGGRIVRIVDTPRLGGGQFIEAIAEEKPIRDALSDFARRTLLIGLAIAVATGALVFFTLNLALVRPIRRLIRSMTRFREAPEQADRVLVPSGRSDEIGDAEEALAAMQAQVRASLTQRSHLAAMGSAVAKINHDLRNILSGAQLASEQLEQSDDPQVRRMAPRLLRALDRAIGLAADTLTYGKAGERAPVFETIELRGLADEVALAAGAQDATHVRFHNRAPDGVTVRADGEQLYRILLNLVRNAVQAIEMSGRISRLSIDVACMPGRVCVDISDEGPGIPGRALASLFEPFGGSGHSSGTGLGLAIARELARNHGGELELLRSGADGTTFRLTLPADER